MLKNCLQSDGGGRLRFATILDSSESADEKKVACLPSFATENRFTIAHRSPHLSLLVWHKYSVNQTRFFRRPWNLPSLHSSIPLPSSQLNQHNLRFLDGFLQRGAIHHIIEPLGRRLPSPSRGIEKKRHVTSVLAYNFIFQYNSELQ